jgi:hypothetical protein
MQYLQQFLKIEFPNVFGNGELIPDIDSYESYINLIKDNQINISLFEKAASNNILSERDRLQQYSVGSYYMELELFLIENNRKNNIKTVNED